MKIFLIVVLAVVAGLFLFLAIGWWWIKRKLAGLGKALAALGSAGLPPFRITLETALEGPEWSDSNAVAAASAELEALGYERAGDFAIPEMAYLPVRGFANEAWHFYAAVYDHPEAGVIADIVCNLEDGTHHTVSSSPETGLDQPPWAPMVRLPLEAGERGAVGQLHDRLRSEVAERPRVAATPGAFADIFVDAYRNEMDWRISRGGPTAEEIRRVAALTGEKLPDDAAVDLVQSMWRGAIDDFVEDEVREAYLSGTSLSAGEWEEKRDRLYIVHEHADPAPRIDILAWGMVRREAETDDWEAQEDAQEEAKRRLEPIFTERSPREAFAAAQDLLPDDRRYQPLGSVDEPWGADLYLMPEEDCGDT